MSLLIVIPDEFPLYFGNMKYRPSPRFLGINERYPGGHYQQMLGSKDPKERAKALEIQRLAEAWMKRLMERYPELAVAAHPVPDERNGGLTQAASAIMIWLSEKPEKIGILHHARDRTGQASRASISAHKIGPQNWTTASKTHRDLPTSGNDGLLLGKGALA